MIYDVIIIGSGASGYAVAERLYANGIKNICLFSEKVTCGTSRNAGSDKQTYYKLDISSPCGDSVRKMAEDLFNGGSMNGSDAYLEAANSLRCFMHLVELGVPFPKDPYGVFHGYRTDHDNTNRATSAGPLTSRYMTERLEEKIRECGIEVRDGYTAVKLIIKDKKCCGAYFLNGGKIVPVSAKAVILCTGAPAAIYENSVYPIGHKGATGLAIEAGAELQNFQEWQYGIASKKFRWNLSGSYQQVIPRYVSVDNNGNETEFLKALPDYLNLIFLKGYEWPFDSNKTGGSSQVDILVSREIAKGNRVYLDYMHNPSDFDFSLLNDASSDYLEKADTSGITPIERLLQLNPKAYELYLNNGIDLKKEYLEIGVCAQHNNGGIRVDAHGETNIKGLFCAGEASGRFGVYRPGGAALNDTQVGALLISDHLKDSVAEYSAEEFTDSPELPKLSEKSDISEINSYFAVRMSESAANVRNIEKIKAIASELDALLNGFESRTHISSADEYEDYFALRCATVSRLALCRTILGCAEKCGSRGGCMYIENGEKIPENTEYRKFITVTSADGVSFIPVDRIPTEEYVFEKLLKK
ncbi:MAG: FAD-binding protein [Clostridia bacterium]|nr:FAD-binding protein [Clostridia bacterium]